MKELSEPIISVEQFLKITIGRSNSVFRGQPYCDKCKLLPTIARTIDNKLNGFESWLSFERHILQEFKRYSFPYLDFTPENNFELLILGRHYNLPTRIIGWTSNPLVALFFALIVETVNNVNLKSVVWIYQPTVRISISFKDFENIDIIHLFYPKAINKRIIAQQACFTVHPLPDSNEPIIAMEDDIAVNRKLEPIIITSDNSKRKNMLYQLSNIGINYQTVFPDLEGLSKQIAYTLKK